MTTIDLTPLYYLNNFHLVLNWVLRHSADLLTSGHYQQSLLFQRQAPSAQALLVRLLMRKGCHFRADKWCYPEIHDLAQAVDILQESGFLKKVMQLPIEYYADLHTLPELRLLWPDYPRQLKKADFIQALSLSFTEEVPVCTDIVVLNDACRQWSERLLLLFFGNRYQDWTQFVLADLGLHRYEKVSFAPGSRAFRHLDDVVFFELLQDSRHQLQAASHANVGQMLENQLERVLQGNTDSAWLAQRRAKTLFILGQCAEKKKAHLELAERAYTHSAWPWAAVRLVRVLELKGELNKASELAQSLLQDKDDEVRARVLSRMLRRMRRSQRMPCSDHATADASHLLAQTRLTLAHNPSIQGVERAVQAYYQTSSNPVYYVENVLIQGLLGLLCWDAFFMPVPGAFFHPFQRGPADLHSPDFYRQRRAAFQACWEQLDNGCYAATILRRWHEKQGLQSDWVKWSALDLQCVRLALQCIPALHLKQIFVRILSNIREYRSGLPDLIQFFPLQNKYEWIEVKGPGDRLQDNQQGWLRFFSQNHMPARVCYVDWKQPCTV